MPNEQTSGKPTTRRYSPEEKAAAVRMGSMEGPDGQPVTMTLREDRTFEFTAVPRRVFGPNDQDPTLDWNDLVDAQGRWSISESGADPYPLVDLYVDDPTPTETAKLALHARGDLADLELFIFVSAADDVRFVFTRDGGTGT